MKETFIVLLLHHIDEQNSLLRQYGPKGDDDFIENENVVVRKRDGKRFKTVRVIPHDPYLTEIEEV